MACDNLMSAAGMVVMGRYGVTTIAGLTEKIGREDDGGRKEQY